MSLFKVLIVHHKFSIRAPSFGLVGSSPNHLQRKIPILPIDDFSHFSWFFPLTFKSDFYYVFVNFCNVIDRTFPSFKIHAIQCYIDGEFSDLVFRHFLQSKGIVQRFSYSYTPQQNDVVEHKHDHINSVGRCFLIQASLPHEFWVDGFSNAVFVIDRMPSSTINNKSPYELYSTTFPTTPYFAHLVPLLPDNSHLPTQ